MLVTRAEEWCVEAENEEEARRLLARGEGHRCHSGDRVQLEFQHMLICWISRSLPHIQVVAHHVCMARTYLASGVGHGVT
jgi:hypothetical protein